MSHLLTETAVRLGLASMLIAPMSSSAQTLPPDLRCQAVQKCNRSHPPLVRSDEAETVAV